MLESELVSHQTFEHFCGLTRIPVQRIRPAARPRPDYKIRIGQKGCIVELKQLEPNPEDKRQRQEEETKGESSRGPLPLGNRLRNAVRSAADQLQPWAKRGVPSLLVLLDNTHPFSTYLDPYEIKAGMYGLDVFRFAMPDDVSQGAYPLGWASGGKASITREQNTSFSAVGRLCPYPTLCPYPSAPYLVLYHNDFAAVPLDPECVAGVTEYQYRWQDRRPDEIGCWMHAITGVCDEVFGPSSG